MKTALIPFTELKKLIAELLDDKTQATPRELTEKTGAGYHSVLRALRRLNIDGLVREVGHVGQATLYAKGGSARAKKRDPKNPFRYAMPIEIGRGSRWGAGH